MNEREDRMAAAEREVFQQPEYRPNTGMVIPVRLLTADVALRQFIMERFREAQKVGYPRMSAFAVDIARGTLGLPPPTEDDPVHDAVAVFYSGLREIDRRILAEFYLPGWGSLKQKAKRVGKSVKSFKKSVEWLIYTCQEWLKSKGLA